jgi:GTP pyrophosphokinase
MSAATEHPRSSLPPPAEAADGRLDVRAGARAQEIALRFPSCAEGIGADAAAADILMSLGMDDDTVAAARLVSAAYAEGTCADWLVQSFGRGVAALAEGAYRAESVRIGVRSAEALGEKSGRVRANDQGMEALRKMLLAMARDARVVLIVLARRLVVMRGLPQRPEAERRETARETLDLYAPLANRLGIWQLKWELEDLAFRWIEPELYKKIARLLDEKRGDREGYIEVVKRRLVAALGEAGVDAEVTGRPKHIFSIYKKMQRKHLDFTELYDVRALRVLVPQVKDCYTVLGVVHDLWQPISGEFDDYISHPKGNFYRSLHTAVIGPEEKPVEVQIRTHDMHHDSELGIAAHWRYKEGVRQSDRRFEERVAWLRQMLAWKDEIAAGAVAEPDGAEDPIYVLTPQGEVVDLPAGSTPVDFAYRLHTELGHRCRGAKVDGSIVPLTYRLRNAQRIEIVSAKTGGPSRDWLNTDLGYLRSPRALAKVRQWFKQQRFEEDVAHGRSVLDRELHRMGIHEANFEKLAQRLHYDRTEDFLAALGRGELTVRQVDAALESTRAPEADRAPDELPELKPAVGLGPGVSVLGVGNIATTLAKCCKPLRPEPIVGFVTSGRGVVIHRADCGSLGAMRPEQRDRLMAAEWGGGRGLVCATEIVVLAADRRGLLRDVSETMAREKINVTAVNTLSRSDHARMQFTCEVEDATQLSRLLVALRSVPGVLEARRK